MNYHDSPGLAQAIFEGSPHAQLLLNASGGRVLDANAAAQRLCGFALRELIATPVERLFRWRGEPGLGALSDLMRRAHSPDTIKSCRLRTYQPAVWARVDVTVTRLAVKPVPVVLLTVLPSRSSGSPKPVAQRLNRIVAGAAHCLWSAVADAQGVVRIDYLSPAIQRVAGRPARYFGKDLVRWRELVLPLDLNIWERAWNTRRMGRSTDDEYRIVWPDGSSRWVFETVRAAPSGRVNTVQLFGVLGLLDPQPSTSIGRRLTIPIDATNN